jgi:hypothetical protein
MEETKDKSLEQINLMFSPAAAASIRAAQIDDHASVVHEKGLAGEVVEQE